MKISFKIKRKIEYVLFPKRDRNGKYQRANRRVATMIKAILENNGVNISVIHFTDIKMIEKKQKIVIICTMMRPGVFIGRAGRTFDLVRDTLSDYYGREVEIQIREKILWN